MTSRRQFLNAAASMPLMAGMAACTATVSSNSQRSPQRNSQRNYTPSGLPLRRVNVSEDRIIRTIAGLRPFRRSGFNVSAERRNDKVLVHNYGHGGGGITLSWGSSHLAMELATQTPHKRCAVLGSGVMGLTTARLMQDQGWEVAIYTKDLPPNTTSNIAGGQWSATSVFDKPFVTPSFMSQYERAMQQSYRYFQNLVGPRYGVRWISNYHVLPGPMDGETLPEQYPYLYPQRIVMNRNQHPFDADHVYHYDTMLIEPAVFLLALIQDFHAAGGKMNVREIHSQSELMNLDEPVIINCTGLGAKELFNDQDMLAIKGQLSFLLPQPEVNYIVLGNNGHYMFPRSDGVLLGGTFDRDIYDTTPDANTRDQIVDGHREFFNAMEDPWA
jgi:D-amino-acid oxidase